MTDGQPGGPPPGHQPQQPQYPGSVPSQPHAAPGPGPAPGHWEQPYYQPAPGSLPPVVPPKKSNTKRVVIIVGIVVLLPLLAIGGCVGALVFSTQAESDAANDLFAALQSGDTNAAQALVSPACTLPIENVQAFIGNSQITDYAMTGRAINNGVTSVSGTVTFDGTDQRIVEVVFEDEMVCRVSIGAEGQTSFDS